MGVVLVIDATSPDTMARAKRIIAMVAAHRVPFVIAANKKDLPDLMSESKIRKSLGVLEDIPLIFISATRKADVIFVLESLVDYITRFAY
jgi:signal recognition particle receptor subunit beta